MGRMVEARYGDEANVQWFPIANAIRVLPHIVVLRDDRYVVLRWPHATFKFDWSSGSWRVGHNRLYDKLQHINRQTPIGRRFMFFARPTFEQQLNRMASLVEEAPLTSAFGHRYLGYHKDEYLPVEAGSSVVIPKGCPITSTHPQKGNYKAGRTYEVEVYRVLNGTSVTCHGTGSGKYAQIHLANPSIRWIGTGSYWFEADINDLMPP